jgi:hypothetical protein
MVKFHIGLVAENKNLESAIKSAADQMGGAYVHHSKSALELIQKLVLQKVQMILVELAATGDGSDFSSLFSFFRSKKELQNIPICVLTEADRMEVRFLLTDVLVRGFPRSGGVFIPLLSMAPLLQAHLETNEILSRDWIQQEFLESLQANVGQAVLFQVREANEDERRSPFYSQQAQEVRTHLGWFKFTARLLETQESGMSQLFQGMSPDVIEEVAQSLLGKVTESFQQKVITDFATRGAVYLPELELLTAPERKTLYSQARHTGIIYQAPECQVLLEISQYI